MKECKIVVVDVGIGNSASIVNMIRRIGGRAIASSAACDIIAADRLVLPGVGAFDNGIRRLRADGLDEVLHHRVMIQKTPVLGICLGMQLMGNCSEEGTLPGLGWVNASTRKLDPGNGYKVPHMGWNVVIPERPNELLSVGANYRFYFVHSYHVVCKEPTLVAGTTMYGQRFTSAFQMGHITGVQFHPEKSHSFGKELFSKWLGLPIHSTP